MLLKMYFKRARVHPKLVDKVGNMNVIHLVLVFESWKIHKSQMTSQGSWIPPLQPQRATEILKYMSGKTLHRGHERPFCEAVEVKPGFALETQRCCKCQSHGTFSKERYTQVVGSAWVTDVFCKQ